jgi:hypothetical protein
MANVYWGSSDTTWSTVGNWYTDQGLANPLGRLPSRALSDDVHFGSSGGDCTLDMSADCRSFEFTDHVGAYSGTLDFDGYTLSTGYTVNLDAGPTATVLMPGNSELILEITFLTSITFSPIDGSTLGTVRFKFTNASGNYRIFVNRSCTITKMIYDATGAGTSEVLTQSGASGVEVYELQTAGAEYKKFTSLGVTNEWRFHCDIDTRDIDEFSGPFNFGYDTDVTISLRSALDASDYGNTWYFYNDENGVTRTITIATPDGQGLLPDVIRIKNLADSDSDLHVVFSGDITWNSVDYTKNMSDFLVDTPTSSGDVRLTFGSGFETLFKWTLDLRNVSEINGNPDTVLFLMGTENINRLYVTDDLPIPASLRFLGTVVASDRVLDFYSSTHIQGSLQIDTSGIHHRTLNVRGAAFRVDGGIALEWDSTGIPNIVDLYGVGGRWDLESVSVVSGSATDAQIATAADVHVTGSLTIPGVKWSQSNGGIYFHVRAAGGQKLEHDSAASAFKTLVVDLDNATPGASDHEFFFDLSTAQIHFTSIQILNSLDRQFKVLLPAGGASPLLSAGDLTIEGRGDACSFPISDEYAVLVQSDSPGTRAKITSTSSSFPDFTEFTDIDVVSDNAFLDNGTCFDGGNNLGASFEGIAGSIALCPVQSVSFFAYRYANLPAAQSFQVINLGVGDLEEPTASGLPAWLSVTFIDNEDGTWTMQVQPNTTNLAEGVYTDEFDVNVTDARRSPQSFAVTFETSEDIIPLPDTDQVNFYQLRDQTYPDPQTVGVDNTYPAGGTLEQITIEGLPAWLDVEFTVPGPADHQEFKLTVNAVGLALDSGTYNASLVIDAPNAAESYTMTVAMVVERILIDTNVDQVDFSIKQGGALPYDEVVNVSNSGDAGTLAGVTATPSEAWLDATMASDGSGNNQNILVGLNAGAQALAAGEHTAQVTIGSTNADNLPYTFDVVLTVLELEPFTLAPVTVEFTPGRDWSLPAAQEVVVASTGEGSFAAPVTVSGAPSWLQVTVDATDPARQIITLTPTAIPTDDADFSATLTVTGSYSLALPVSMVVPAFFRRVDCVMDFIPRIEGTIVEECEVPPAPPPAPALPPVTPPQPAPTYPKNITMTGPPCIDCIAWVEYDDEEEVGYGKPHYYIECDDHGCDGSNLSSGTYGSTDNTPGGHPGGEGWHVTAIEIDECGHICGIWFDEEGAS